jgi:hypothetical protein
MSQIDIIYYLYFVIFLTFNKVRDLVSDLRQVGGFLQVLSIPLPIQLTATI